MSKSLFIGLLALLVLVIGGFSLYGMANSLKNTGVRFEEDISATYENNQNVLSAIQLSIKEQLGIANVKSTKLDEILQNAVTGRYGEDGFSADGAFFSAVAEAYPDLSGLDIYDEVARTVKAGREQFKNEQAKLRDKVRAYDTWRREGLIREPVVAMFFPSEKLEARIGGQVVGTGDAALRQIRALILEGSAVEAYTTGTIQPTIQ